MSFVVQQADLDVIDQEQRNIKIRAELLNHNFQTIEMVEGNIVQDDYSIDADSDVRRSYNVTFVLDDDTFQIGRDKKVWFDKYLRISVGIYYFRDKEFRWYFIGTYLMNTTQFSYDATNNSLTVSCVDMVAKLNGMRDGQVSGLSLSIPSQIKNDNGTFTDNTIREAMISTITQLGGISNYRIEKMEGTILTNNGYEVLPNIPYDLDFSTGSTVWDIIKTLRDLYPGWETFFDENTFICQPIPLYINDPIVMDAETMSRYVTGEDSNIDFSEMYNVTEVWGACLDATYFTKNTDNEPNNVTMSGSTYNLRYSVVSEILNRCTFGFTANADNLKNPSIQLYNKATPLLGTYPIVGENNQPIAAGTIKANKSYVIEYRTNGSERNFYYLGEYQICAVTKLVSKYPSLEKIQYDLLNEPTTNISYIVNPDSPFCSDYEDVGEIRQVLSGSDYDNIYSEGLALQRAEYENWQTTDLMDSVTLQMEDIPWLDVNQKVEYYSNSLGKTQIYLIKSKKGSSSAGVSTVNMVKFSPLYPWLR